MLLVTALLALPFVVAFALYWFEWRPAKLANHGELVEPPIALPETGLTLCRRSTTADRGSAPEVDVGHG
jgi:hypothetical protein